MNAGKQAGRRAGRQAGRQACRQAGMYVPRLSLSRDFRDFRFEFLAFRRPRTRRTHAPPKQNG